MKLYTTEAQYKEATKKAGARAGKTITIDRQLFVNLTLDHSRLAKKLEELGERVEPGKPEA